MKTILYLTTTDKQMDELLTFLPEKERTMSEIRKEANRIADERKISFPQKDGWQTVLLIDTGGIQANAVRPYWCVSCVTLRSVILVSS